MRGVVYELLPIGRAHALPWRQLCDLLGYSSKRELQKQIAAERNAGYIILSDFEGKGYFRSSNPEDLQAFERTISAKARNTYRMLRSVQAAIANATGQEQIEGW